MPEEKEDKQDVTYTPQQLQEEIRKAVETATANARKEEKDKLYADLTTLKQSLKDREDQLTALKKEKPNMPDDKKEGPEVDALKSQIQSLQDQIKASQDNFRSILDDTIKKQESAFQNVLKQRDLEAEKRLIVSEADGKIIPDLLKGDNVEELRASAEFAKKRYTEIFEAGAKSKLDEAETKIRESMPAPANPGSQASELTDVQGGPPSWRRMSMDEWNKQKAQIKQEAFKRAKLPMRAKA